ncbi:Aste57867_1245 [Aphanomyces stellatus]|uniref:Aste57867_1245 protein n=1 Tax=Aphanomyces stellatus TaxID=120398 RepID=A0A485K828_9STRA|nr:hypothetical protein As57867_001244 [Aphanomyces stellatus]VFT78464.1 Aste57867_1245 [Aphanomyces stellatus]
MDLEEQELLQQSMQQGLSGQEDYNDLNLRPKTMFEMKGRARPSENAADNYLPQWSKDGDGFKKQSAAAAADDRRKNKVVFRYTREELLALHVVSTSPPECPEGTPVIAPDSLPPVANIPFDYEEIYKQWASNKERNRQPGRGRGQPRDGTSGNATQSSSSNTRTNGNNGSGRIGGRSNDNDGNAWEKGRRGSEDSADTSGRKWNEKRGDDQWERGARVDLKDEQDDLWDDVDPMGGDSKDMGLSNFAEAAELFRREMDQMHRDGGSEFRQQTPQEDVDQFADSVEEEEQPPMWDMPATDTEKPQNDAPASLDLASWSSFEQPAPALRVSPPVDAWFYLDPQGLQQGPFKSSEMREWFEAGYFKPHLPIRFGNEGEFASLANHFRHGQIPFSTIPSPSPPNHLLQQQEQQQKAAAAAAAAAAAHQQQLLLQKQQLEQAQYLANQLQQQRLLEQRRAQEERMIMEMQRMELNHHAAAQEQARLMQQFHGYNNPVGSLGSVGAVGSGWPRQALPRDNIIAGARDSMMGGLGMYAPPQPQPVVEAPADFGAPAWDTKDEGSSSLWHSAAKNDPELSAWGKPAVVEDEQPAWTKAEADWNKDPPLNSWGKQEPAQPTASVGGWGQPDVAPQPSPTSWGKAAEPTAEPVVAPSAWGKAPEPTPAASLGAWDKPSSPMGAAPVATPEKQVAREEQTSSGWEAPAPETPSLKQIQQEEQEEMRRRLKPAKQQKQAPAAAPQHHHDEPEVQPTPAAQQQPHLADMGQQLKRMLGVANPSPPKSSWGNVVAPTPAPVARSLSLRDIQAEEERLAQLKRKEQPAAASSRWSSVVTGTTPNAAIVPAVVAAAAAPRPAPVEVKTSPPKDRDASFWNFDQQPATAARATTPSNAFGAQSANDDLISWSAKQVKKLGGTEDLTLIQYCATLEDPGEIREYLAAYLGSTPKVSAFATEFIQKKKQMAGKKQSSNDAKAAAFQKKKGKGQKVDASFLGYSVGGSRSGDIEYGS